MWSLTFVDPRCLGHRGANWLFKNKNDVTPKQIYTWTFKGMFFKRDMQVVWVLPVVTSWKVLVV